jgi:hypothetical protein
MSLFPGQFLQPKTVSNRLLTLLEPPLPGATNSLALMVKRNVRCRRHAHAGTVQALNRRQSPAEPICRTTTKLRRSSANLPKRASQSRGHHDLAFIQLLSTQVSAYNHQYHITSMVSKPRIVDHSTVVVVLHDGPRRGRQKTFGFAFTCHVRLSCSTWVTHTRHVLYFLQPKVVLVSTSANDLQGHKTGLWIEELAAPYYGALLIYHDMRPFVPFSYHL